MSQDFLVTYPSELIPLTAVVEGVTADGLRVLTIQGADFRAVDEVLLNDTVSPHVVVSGRTVLTALVPLQLGTDHVTSVQVFSNKITLSASSLIRFKLGDVTTKTSGMLKLMQLFLKTLFTSPGRDIFDPQLGGDALRNIGRTFGRGQGASIVGDYVIAVERAAKQVIAIQARDHMIPRDERLLNVKVDSARFDMQQSALVTTTSLYNQAGKVGLANVTL